MICDKCDGAGYFIVIGSSSEIEISLCECKIGKTTISYTKEEIEIPAERLKVLE